MGKNAVSCKFNHAAVKTDKDISSKLTAGDSEDVQTIYKCNNNCGSQCANSVTKKPGRNFGLKNLIALANKLPLYPLIKDNIRKLLGIIIDTCCYNNNFAFDRGEYISLIRG